MLTIAAADEARTADAAARYPDRRSVSCLTAREQGGEVGWLAVSTDEHTLVLLEAEAQDDGTLEGLVRAALFSAYRAGRAAGRIGKRRAVSAASAPAV